MKHGRTEETCHSTHEEASHGKPLLRATRFNLQRKKTKKNPTTATTAYPTHHKRMAGQKRVFGRVPENGKRESAEHVRVDVARLVVQIEEAAQAAAKSQELGAVALTRSIEMNKKKPKRMNTSAHANEPCG
jgi:hypothetical protein